mmetsp:Transcript_4153/g.11151  ORF Transcript_4153/g.11151 Transcript_4153/m.11151 type:complete len:220 (-) Transcript_4153:31-690(-)
MQAGQPGLRVLRPVRRRRGLPKLPGDALHLPAGERGGPAQGEGHGGGDAAALLRRGGPRESPWRQPRRLAGGSRPLRRGRVVRAHAAQGQGRRRRRPLVGVPQPGLRRGGREGAEHVAAEGPRPPRRLQPVSLRHLDGGAEPRAQPRDRGGERQPPVVLVAGVRGRRRGVRQWGAGLAARRARRLGCDNAGQGQVRREARPAGGKVNDPRVLEKPIQHL